MILFLSGCATTNSVNSVNSINSSNSATQSQQSNISSGLPASSGSAAVKDDAYYENLIKDIKYPDIYGVKSDANLLDVIESFVYGFDVAFRGTEFSSPQELTDENIYFYLNLILGGDQFPEHEMTRNEEGDYFYKRETIEKYAYYFFNYKIDCSKIEGWSEEKQGIYREAWGLGGDFSYPAGDLKQIEPGKYQFTAVIKFDDDNNSDYTLTAILGVEQNRVCLISFNRESINY